MALSKFLSWFGRKEVSEPPVEPVRFEPLNDLEIALIAAAHEESARGEFQKLLLQSQLYVATPEAPPAAEERTLNAGETLQLINVPGPGGKPTPALFTDASRLAAAFGAGTGYLLMPAASLLEMIVEDGAILNPGQPYRVIWSRDDILQMLGRPVRRTMEKETQILVGTPANRPRR
jgi:hypothetical protein